MIREEQTKPHNQLGKVLTMREHGRDRKAGVPKTHDTTQRMVYYISELVKRGQVVFSSQLMAGQSTTVQAMRDKLLSQMRQFKCETKVNKNDNFAEPKRKWMGPQDDLLVSMMTAIFWESIFIHSTYQGYESFKRLCATHSLYTPRLDARKRMSNIVQKDRSYDAVAAAKPTK
jgi:hypothetical protein